MAYDDAGVPDHSRGPAVLAVSAVTLACCSVFVFLRLVARFGVVKKPGWDDYTIIVAWLLAFGTSFTICYGTTKGLGKHQQFIAPDNLVAVNKSAYAFSILYNPALMATKTSILVFYLSMAEMNKVFRWATIATMVVVNAGGVALTFLNAFQCTPASAAFHVPVRPPQHCINIVTIYLSSAPLNIITDLAIFFLPLPSLTGMHLPRKQKIILVVTFCVGLFVVAVDVVRIYYLQDAQRQNLRAKHDYMNAEGSNADRIDFSWFVSFSSMWSAVEINIGIMCACVPQLKMLVKRFLPHWVLDHTVRESKTGDSIALASNVETFRRAEPPSPPLSPTSKPPEASGTDDEPVDFMNFLTTPDMAEMPRVTRNETIATCGTTIHHRADTSTFFDFVNMQERKNITLRTNGESVFPVTMVTVLFFIWGFAYGLLDTLNAQFQAVAHMTDNQTVGQHSAYYLGYLLGPITFGWPVFRHWGFKGCYMVGLGVYACGTLVFWPSAVLTSFPAFLISNFIVGLGLSTLELGANPFIALCGPPEYAEVRLCLSQGIQAIGTIVSPLLARKVLFHADANSLIDVQWAYLGIAFFTVFLAIFFFYVPLPEATDEELETASARMPIPRQATVTFGNQSMRIIWLTLALGVFSQFCYVGGQESTSTSFAKYFKRNAPNLDPIYFQTVGHTGFAVSRLLAAFACIWIKPRFVLTFCFAGVIAFAAAAMPHQRGSVDAAMVIVLLFFEGPLFPLIYAQTLRGLGKYTKGAAVLLTSAIGGGAVIPPIMYGVSLVHNTNYAYCVVVAFYATGALFAVWLNLLPSTRTLVDPVRDEQTRRESQIERERRESTGTRTRHGKWGKLMGKLSASSDESHLPWVEHREGNSWPENLAPATADAVAMETLGSTRNDSPHFDAPWSSGGNGARAHEVHAEDFVEKGNEP